MNSLYLRPLTFVMCLSLAVLAQAAEKEKTQKKVKYRKVQSVSFDGDDVTGVARNPMSSYLMQNKVMQFVPLYKVREKVNEDLLKSLESLR